MGYFLGPELRGTKTIWGLYIPYLLIKVNAGLSVNPASEVSLQFA